MIRYDVVIILEHHRLFVNLEEYCFGMKRLTEKSAKPFIKWVGGKTQLLDEVKKLLPTDLRQREGVTYVEPFVGGGAVLFWILQEYPNIEKAVINDINAELICTYFVIKGNVEALIQKLNQLQSEYIPLNADDRKDYFLEKRAQFNSRNISDVETAALFIFLNRTCFNGLYRVNSKGEFNVPHGKYSNPKICDEDTLRADSALLQKVEILCGDFSETERFAGPDAVFYFDSPYKPLTETTAFTSYAKDGFDDNEQRRLGRFIDGIAAEGSAFVASNSDPKNVNPEENFFDKLYHKFTIKRVSASSSEKFPLLAQSVMGKSRK